MLNFVFSAQSLERVKVLQIFEILELVEAGSQGPPISSVHVGITCLVSPISGEVTKTPLSFPPRTPLYGVLWHAHIGRDL